RSDKAWRDLVEAYNTPRAIWIVRRFMAEGYVTNQNGPVFLDPATLPLKPDSWSRPPRSLVMPDRFLVRVYVNEKTFKETVGAPIPHPLPIGFDPFGVGGDTAAAWIDSFETALAAGMAVKIDLSDTDPQHGYD